MINNKPLNTKFLFNDTEYPITIQSNDWQYFSRDAFITLLMNNQIIIPSDISEEVFQSFIDYFERKVFPDIQQNNINEYSILNKIFQVPSIDALIQSKLDYYTQSLNNINCLNDPFQISQRSKTKYRNH